MDHLYFVSRVFFSVCLFLSLSPSAVWVCPLLVSQVPLKRALDLVYFWTLFWGFGPKYLCITSNEHWFVLVYYQEPTSTTYFSNVGLFLLISPSFFLCDLWQTTFKWSADSCSYFLCWWLHFVHAFGHENFKEIDNITLLDCFHTFEQFDDLQRRRWSPLFSKRL